MDDVIELKDNYLRIKSSDEKYVFHNSEELCDVIFNYINNTDFYRIFVHKRVLYKNESRRQTLKEGLYINPDGFGTLNAYVDKEYLPVFRSMIYNFNFKRKNEDKANSLIKRP